MTRLHLAIISPVASASVLLALGLFTRAEPVLRALPTNVTAPADNPTTPEKIALGRLLFWDPILSGPKDVACATCHHPDLGYADDRDVSIGVHGVGLGATRVFASGHSERFVKRNSQTLLNSAFNGMDRDGNYAPADAPMFWDARVKSLEAQSLEPIKALEEMRGDTYTEKAALATVVARLAAIPEYREQFAQAFGARNAVTERNLARALAAFERSLVASNTPFDRYMRGDTTAMTTQQVRGMTNFQTAGCANCHSGPMFSDYKPHVLAVPDNNKLAASDSGRNGSYAFRTASLRNLAFTAPYMHSGAFTSLRDVVNFYNRVRGGGRGRGGRDGGGGGFSGGTQNPNVARDQLDPLVRQLNLRGGRQNDIVAFLGALNDSTFDKTVPARVPSGLNVGGSLGR